MLLTPRPGQADGSVAPTAASPAAPASAAAPGDLSPRADDAATDPAGPLPDPAVVGLPRDVSLAELFPAEAAMGASSPDPGQPGTVQAVQAGHIGDDTGGSSSRLPLIAGMIVTLAILSSGGGFLWWRNRDTYYWPA